MPGAETPSGRFAGLGTAEPAFVERSPRPGQDAARLYARSGFRRVLVVNGHGGNAPIAAVAKELMADWPEMSIKYHPWWAGPKLAEAMREVDPVGSHASWIENFPWTRLESAPAPGGEKPPVDHGRIAMSSPEAVRALIGDGNFGGAWEKPDDVMLKLWQVGVEETRAELEGPWPNRS